MAGQPLRADIDGFSLLAAARVEARDRKRLELLCRYIKGPALRPRVRIQRAAHRFCGIHRAPGPSDDADLPITGR
jgi:hypothetical protein